MAHSQSSPRGLWSKKSIIIPPSVSAIPTYRVEPGALLCVKNSTGAIMIAMNTTGTTWKYLSKTSVLV
jgi:hypothetical protein